MKAPTIHMLTSLLAATLLMAAAMSCVEPFTPVDPVDDGQPVELPLRISVPASGLIATKSETIAPETAEAAAKELQIWAFKHGDEGSAVAYRNVPSTSAPQDGVYETTLPISRQVITSGILNLDFFVVANGSSIGGVHKMEGSDDVTATMTRSELMALAFGKTVSGETVTDYFGNTTKTDAVPASGLPMSCFNDTGFDITFLKYGLTTLQIAAIKAKATGDDKDQPYDLSAFDELSTKLSDTQKEFIQNTLCPQVLGTSHYPYWSELWSKLCPSFQLTRAVSKIRFIFTKAQNMSESTDIISIMISDQADEGAIPLSTYLFPHTPIAFPGNSFETVTWGDDDTPLLDNTDIKTIDTPYRLLWTSGMTAQAYTTLLNTAVDRNEVTEKLLYLRESDKALKCKVTYKIDNTSHEATFTLPEGADFHRNSWWTIYAFFMSYKLNFLITVYDWDTYGKGVISIGNTV